MKVSYVRYLDSYPTGRKRAFLLTMAVLASLITSYEAAIAPVVPLLLEDLQMTLPTYGAISAAAAVAGALSGIIAGRLTDKVGRVKLLVPAMLVTALLCFAMTLVTTPGELLTVRCVLSFVDGIAIACTAPLVRDFSPRMGRATAFGFWTWGPVGANFLSAAIAGDRSPTPEVQPVLERFTQRELAVLAYLPTMLTSAEIAGDLFVTVNTVKTHQRAIYRKLGVSSRREAVERARAHRLLH